METTLQRKSFAAWTFLAALMGVWSSHLLAEEMPPLVEESGPPGRYAIQRKIVSEAWEFRIIETEGAKSVSPSIATSSYPIAKNSHIFAWGPGRKALIAITNQGKFFDCTLWALAPDGRRFTASEFAPELDKAAVRALQTARPDEKNVEILNKSMRIVQATDAGAQSMIRFGLLADSDEYVIEFIVDMQFAAPAFALSGAQVRDTRDKIVRAFNRKQTASLLVDTP
ncbi:hypothetical protein [Roseimicrobium sp. ORNL1]|uniref:hypothetical protein n=1 Tax=Roseimicrobium sp. ORNL1 TaxID=2711231 RepID=UPI0013E0EAA0|nr:hypothetical protein [Roseimicrobium sp. ORNL1]QIF00235.1 hypothetical protein G5S37_01415 [Roseimicrobium sp. ORNL1]